MDRLWYGISLVAFIGALLSKAVGIVLPAVLLLYEFLLAKRIGLRHDLERILKSHWPFWFIGIFYLAGVRQLLHTALVQSPVRGLETQIYTQLKALVYYVKLLALPHGLNVEHQFILADTLYGLPALTALLLVFAVGGLGLVGKSKRRILLFWLLWPLFILLPTLLVPLNVLVNEHRLYLPAVAFAVLLGNGMASLLQRYRRFGVIIGVVWLGTYGLLAHQRTQVWQDHSTLWGDALEKAPLMPRPHLYMGDHFKSIGEHRMALQEYDRALEVYPRILSGGDLVAIYNNKGATYLSMERNLEAIESYGKALDIDSTYAKSRDALDALLALQEQERDPRAKALHKKGLQLLVLGRLDEAVEHLNGAIEIQVVPEYYMALGIASERLQDWETALQAFETLKILVPETDFAQTANDKISSLRKRLRGDLAD